MIYSRIVILLSALVTKAVSQCDFASVCITDLSQDDCEAGFTLVPNSAVHGCCPSCQPSTGITPQPGCQSPSNCLSGGRYAPVQCKGDMITGRCFCSDEDGNRIFGQMWRSEATDMTCACSRRRADMEKSGRYDDVTLHCTDTGDYEPLQCDDGLCWCAQPKTGQLTAIPVLEDDMTLLPCYAESVIGEQYLRRCESEVIAIAEIRKEQREHGTSFLGSAVSICDYDGSYGPYQIVNGIAYCTNRNGEILGSWQIVSSEMSGMNCNCARDTMIYFPERGMTVTEVCQANGNYRPNQNVGDVYYCVDSDGFRVTDFLNAWPDDTCASFA